MDKGEFVTEEAVLSGLIRRNTSSRSTRRTHAGFICLGLVSVFIAQGRCIAQQGNSHLTVRPHEMATGATNPAVGEYPLDSAPDVLVSVPQQCVGAHRCPLFVFLPGGGQTASMTTKWLRPVADKYGMILFAPSEEVYQKPSTMDAAMKEILRKFSIDPDKIAIIGRCASGYAGMRYGIDNLDVFNRIVSISGGISIDGIDAQNKTAEFLIDKGFTEYYAEIFEDIEKLRRDGHPAKAVMRLRGHEHQVEDYDFLGRWLQESWSKPNQTANVAPPVVADPLPTLTSEALKQMTAFWAAFQKEPDSILTTARRAHLQEVTVPVGEWRSSVVLMNMPALAAKYPSVAADLKKAGLTAQQHDAYRVALISAIATKTAIKKPGAVDPTSLLGKNIAFLEAHLDEYKALARVGIEHPDRLLGLGGNGAFGMSPESPQDKSLGAMGIWRTP